jgi:hypothetical protein
LGLAIGVCVFLKLEIDPEGFKNLQGLFYMVDATINLFVISVSKINKYSKKP